MVPTLFFFKKTFIIFGSTLPKHHWIRHWVGHNSKKIISKLKKTYSEKCSANTVFLSSMPKTFKKPVKESKLLKCWRLQRAS